MIKTIMNILANEIKAVGNNLYCEIDYMGEYDNIIDIRFYDKGQGQKILDSFVEKGIISSVCKNEDLKVELPSESEVKYAFSGSSFERILIELPEELHQPVEEFMQVEVGNSKTLENVM